MDPEEFVFVQLAKILGVILVVIVLIVLGVIVL